MLRQTTNRSTRKNKKQGSIIDYKVFLKETKKAPRIGNLHRRRVQEPRRPRWSGGEG